MLTREEQKEQRYQQILMIALEEFNKKGYYGTSTREISKLAGISSGLMFHYFDSKLALYEALVELGCQRMGEWLNVDPENPLLFIEEAVTSIFDGLKTNLYFAKMFIFIDSAHNTPEISEKANALLAQNTMIELTTPIFKKGQQLGQIREGDPFALSMAFWCSIQGIAQERVRSFDKPMPDADWIIDIIKKN